jgi:hypothetical protein
VTLNDSPLQIEVDIAETAGVAGCALTTILVEAGEVHPALFTVKVYVPAGAVTNPVPDMLTLVDGVNV